MFDQALLQLLNDGEFHTEEQLVAMLQIPSGKLTQDIQQLQILGLEIEYEPRSGYRLSPGIRLLEKSLILSSLSRNLQDSLETFDIHLTIDSTNTEAMRYVRKGNRGKALIVAEKQESGRGRRGRNWVSPMARNIYMTLVWPFDDTMKASQGLSLVIALSLVKSLQNSALKGMENLKVKWPNDVWLNNKKLAGILLELYRGADGAHQVIIGIGINVNMPEESLNSINQAATDLVSQGNKTVDRNVILANLIQQLEFDIELFTEQGFSGFQDQWQQLDLYHNKEVEVLAGTSSTFGQVKGVSPSGALILKTDEGDQLIMGGELAPSVRAANAAGKI